MFVQHSEAALCQGTLQLDGCGSHLKLLFEAQHPQGAEAVNQSGRHVRKGGVLRAAQDERTGNEQLGEHHIMGVPAEPNGCASEALARAQQGCWAGSRAASVTADML